MIGGYGGGSGGGDGGGGAGGGDEGRGAQIFHPDLSASLPATVLSEFHLTLGEWSAFGTTPSGPFCRPSSVFRPVYSVKELSPATMTSTLS